MSLLHFPGMHAGSSPSSSPKLELWGGIECTVARIQDDFRNQVVETGHAVRIDDLDAIAALGIKTLRYPVIWETIAPDHPDACDWTWHDARLGRLRELGIAPIAGLVHHGSGPRYTNLLDPAFPGLLARHAQRVAMRYPWIEMFTPVNEPLTTARFSGLYGHWYPHRQSVDTVLRMLVVQCRAVIESMQAIRRITPQARLVQTEDMGKAFGTPVMQRQADYENERRWLSLDLLCGRIDRHHGWYGAFIKAGISPQEMQSFLEADGKPDIIGINHYVTSERFLDHRTGEPAIQEADSTQPERYADFQALRADLPADQLGPHARLWETWQRYRLPIAITEAHTGGTRDEQLRWLMTMWNAAIQASADGADIRAVTVWSILGCVDWNSLLIEKRGFYEAGLFDVRSTPPRPTALAAAASALAMHGTFAHPVATQPGWWQRDDRFHVPRPAGQAHAASHRHPLRKHAGVTIAITGAGGTLGQAFSKICAMRGLDHEPLLRADLDIADAPAVEAWLRHARPWAVINTAGYVQVAQAAGNAQRCLRENAEGTAVLAGACAGLGIAYVTFSSDLVFDGTLGRAYVESDPVSPVCTYGHSKVAAEGQVLAACPDALVVRTSAFFGPWDRYNFAHLMLRDLAMGHAVSASPVQRIAPTYVPDLVNTTLDLLIDRANGIWHLTNQGTASWHELALHVAHAAGISTAGVIETTGEGARLTALSSERGLLLPPLDSAIARFIQENQVAWSASMAQPGAGTRTYSGKV